MNCWDLVRCETKRVILGLGDGDEVDDVQDNEMDGETCSESCQDCDVDGCEFAGCKGSVDDLLI